jgi:hypothetical protein
MEGYMGEKIFYLKNMVDVSGYVDAVQRRKP